MEAGEKNGEGKETPPPPALLLLLPPRIRLNRCRVSMGVGDDVSLPPAAAPGMMIKPSSSTRSRTTHIVLEARG